MVFVYFIFLAISFFILSDVKSPYFKLCSFIFAVILGFLIQYEGNESDITRYLFVPSVYASISWENIFDERDFFIPVFAKLVSYVSDSPRFFAVIMYVLYILLFNKSVRLVTANYYGHSCFYIAALFLAYPFTNFNALRFSFATLFFVWCILKIVIAKKKKFYLIILLTPFIHFSYWIFIPLPYLCLIIKDRLWLALLIFAISFVFITPQVSYFINSFAEQYFTEPTANTVALYASEEGLEYMNDRYATGYSMLSLRGLVFYNLFEIKRYAIMAIVAIICVFNYRMLKGNRKLSTRFVLLLLAYSLANVASSVSNGVRFFHTCVFIAVFFFFNVLYPVNDEEQSENLMFINSSKKWMTLSFAITIIIGILYIWAGRYMYIP